MKWRVPRVRLFSALTGLLVVLACALLAASLLGLFARPVEPDFDVRETQAPPATPEAESVFLGMIVRTLGPVNTENETFFASFDFWVAGTNIPPPGDFAFPDAVPPIKLGDPVVARNTPAQDYARYHVEGAFRYRSQVSDVIAGRARIDLRVMEAAKTSAEVLLFPAKADSILLPEQAGRHPATSDGVWNVSSPHFSIRRVSRPTLGDPEADGAETSHSEIAASYILTRASPTLSEFARRLVPERLAAPVLAAMICLLLAVPALSRFDKNPGPWRKFVVLLALTLLLAAAQRVLELYVAPALGPASAGLMIIVVTGGWLALMAAWVLSLMPILVWGPLERQSSGPVSALERMVINAAIIFAFLLFFLANTLELSLAQIGAASGVLTIVLGIALQNIILDLFAGILINLERPFRLLNWITVSAGGTPVHGQVRNMSWRTTQLQTRDNDIVSIPNSVVAKATVNNHAIPSVATRMKLEFVLDPKASPQKARRVMREAALRSAEAGLILDNPPPSVVIREVEDYGVRYRVLFYLNLNMASDSQALNSVAENVLDALAEAKIDLAFRLEPSPFGARHDTRPVMDPGAPAIASQAAPLGPVEPVTDAAAILSPDELKLIRQSWAQVRPLGVTAAALFYDRLFETEPSLRALFRSDAKAQQAKLMTMLNMLVKGLSHPESLVETLTELGLRHRGYSVKPADYGAVGAALLWTLEKGLGDAFDPPTRAAWTKLYGAMASVMIGAADEVAG